MNSPVRTNQYAGRCARCGADVAAKAGVLLRSVWGGWVTYHPSHAPTPDPDGTTSDTSAMRSNQRDGECETCGSVVPAGLGVLVNTGFGGWDVYHREHAREPAPPRRRHHPGWHRRRLMALDIATTGNRYGVDRILGAAVRTTDGTNRFWLIDPGTGPLSVMPRKNHGISVEHARTHGTPAIQALEELAIVLVGQLAAKEPIVVWYAQFVLTTLESELLRHGLTPLSDRLANGMSPICDPLILDRHAEPFRSGGRALETVAEWYGIPHERPGDPSCDAETTLVLAHVIAACHPAVGRLSRPALHREQIRWYEQYAQEAVARRPNRDRDRRWPLETVQVLDWKEHDPL
ncbi:DNA polymerase-3 subunit epsilon [Streptomyces canus]|nr:DNA polymerase-3 subunit epsilon [Streptomyces canus]